ncbi:MAG: molybdopterin-dependent oxidoreductase, partial [Acidovorax sp.]|nr:molybdopterin-dependent oxidoreductase [Acidovorax sp.]
MSANPDSATTVIGACPHDCPDTCSLRTTVVDGVATRVQGNTAHPHTGGVLCAKVSKYTERSYHTERVLRPLKRVGPKGSSGSGQFIPVDWDEALRDIAQRLHAIAQRAPEAVLP